MIFFGGLRIPEFIVVLVEPKVPGNVGAVARSCRNFGVERLVLINPCELGDEAEKRAMHGLNVLHAANHYEDLETAVKDEKIDSLVGTSGTVNTNDRTYVRNPVFLHELTEELKDVEGTVGLLFGREDIGLLNDELFKCDYLATIPANPEYPILNLSHAVNIFLYEIYKLDPPKRVRPPKTNGPAKEKFIQQYMDLCDAVDYPEQKRERVEVLIRRFIARAKPTQWEFHTLMGPLTYAIKRGQLTKGMRWDEIQEKLGSDEDPDNE